MSSGTTRRRRASIKTKDPRTICPRAPFDAAARPDKRPEDNISSGTNNNEGARRNPSIPAGRTICSSSRRREPTCHGHATICRPSSVLSWPRVVGECPTTLMTRGIRSRRNPSIRVGVLPASGLLWPQPRTSWKTDYRSFPFLYFLHADGIHQFRLADEKDRSTCPDLKPRGQYILGHHLMPLCMDRHYRGPQNIA